MDTIERIGRLQQRIAELDAGKEIDAKHITVLLSKERQREFDAEWRRQQTTAYRFFIYSVNIWAGKEQSARGLARWGCRFPVKTSSVVAQCLTGQATVVGGLMGWVDWVKLVE